MKVFITGASGFIGSAIVRELIGAGHQVIGLARSEKSAKAISDAGAEVLNGNLENLESLQQGALQADAVIHAGFVHDFTQYAKALETDKNAINAMGEVLAGTNKPFIVSAGILGLPLIDGNITEESRSSGYPRSSEVTAMALAEKGVTVSVIRLPPSVHDKGDYGFVPFIIAQARKNGVSAYPKDGNNRWPAVHRSDAAKAYRLAVEKPTKGALYNVVGDTGIEVKKIAAVIGEKLYLPVVSLGEEEMAKHFEWMSGFIGYDSVATNLKTQEQLGWKPAHIGLLEDLEQHYF